MKVCKLLHSRGVSVIATVRRQTLELSSLGVEVVEGTCDSGHRAAQAVVHCDAPFPRVNATCLAGVDTGEDDSMQPVLKALGSRNMDLLLISAGCQTLDTIDTVTRAGVRQQFEINALGPLFAVKALRSKLTEGAKVPPRHELRRSLVRLVALRADSTLRPQVVLISSKNGSVTEVDFTGGELVRRSDSRRRHGCNPHDK